MKKFNTLDRELSIKDSKMKYITLDNNNFDDFLSFGKKLKNGEINQDNKVHYAETTRSLENQNFSKERVVMPTQDLFIKKSLKESEEYWDNTKRKSLDTSSYINNPNKVQGNGFGNIAEYDLLFNGIGLSTRQNKPNEKPNNIDNDRLFLTNHNYNNDKYHVTSNLACGSDTRILNKKMI